MNRLYVPLSDAIREQLIRLALKERRHPSQQAALLIEIALRGLESDRLNNPGTLQRREVQPCAR